MIKSSLVNAKDDIQARMLKEQQVEALRVIEALSASLAQSGHLLSSEELSTLNSEINKLAALRETASTPDQLKSAIDAIDKASSEFASRRMDDSIKQALTGQSVDEV
jgi:molecular chaperone HscA